MTRTLVLALLVLLPAGCAFADTIGTVALDTSTLSGGPFTIDFQFISGGTDNDNTVTLSNFAFGGGAVMPGSQFGAATVTSPPLQVVLQNTAFTDAQFNLTPGTSLSFDVDATTNQDPDGPDTFTFAILDNGSEIPTMNPNMFNSFFELDLPAPGYAMPNTIASNSTDNSVTASYTPSAPAPSGVPEPSSLLLVGGAALTTAAFGSKRRGRRCDFGALEAGKTARS